MIPTTAWPFQITDSVDRRVIGALRFVDAVSGLPVTGAVHVEARGATHIYPGGTKELALRPADVRFFQNRTGLAIIERAPFFEDYIGEFLQPAPSDSLQGGILRLHLAAWTAADYLPEEFDCDLPRSLTEGETESVFVPFDVPMFRSPSAQPESEWIILRTRIVNPAGNPLPGVLVRVFRSTRANSDEPIGFGLSDWRGRAIGEALVAIVGIPRFLTGGGPTVIETEQLISFETIRNDWYTGKSGELPRVTSLLSGSEAGLIVAPSSSPPVAAPAADISVSAGREYTVTLTMP